MKTSVSKLIGYESNTMARILSSGIKKTRVEVPSRLLTNHVSLRSSLKCLYSLIYKLRVILVPATVKLLRAEKGNTKCLGWWLAYSKPSTLSLIQHTVIGIVIYQTLWPMLGRN